ncbi:peptide/nickel transport system substrate-binding protein [Thermoanaerobacter uzonensis DSM 18761]|uniref:Peptide/nickel transport system substrate-binding protein n=1 Tax=Thermoanaerobacter uzonensis DSM 18761 TaxID=1123369 RepID=A0A1M4Z372_9THEO|nr:peptide ABC transporter substrate-binding protein [Thermoanaerobacter uzonensis]SHF12247.1 peptide/nickel transport system substrate-binding protein [Thermoanaerobacter uzonensis DSM 18761]
MRKFIILSFILMFIFTGCKTTPQNMVNFPQTSEDKTDIEKEKPAEGGTLRINITSFDTLNPFLNDNERVRQMLNLSLEGLVTLDKTLKPVPQLAENWEISGLNIKFYLKKNVKWQDGVSFTANDVKFTFDSFKSNDVKSPYKDILINYLSSYKTNGDYEFEIILNKPVANPIALFTFPILAEHQYKGKEDILNKDIVPIGTGPYKISSYSVGREVIFERNPYYRGDKPYIDSIVFKIVPNENAMITSFQSKEADFTFLNDIDWDKYKELSNVNIYKYVMQDYVFMAPNYQNPALKDSNVRKAMCYGIDVDKILKEVYFSHGLKSCIPVRPDSWLYSNKIVSHSYDIKEANKILEESGWNLVKGIRSNGTYQLKFDLLVNANNPYLIKVAQIIKNNLKDVGIEINIVPKDWDNLLSSVYSGKFDLALMEWNLSYNQDMSTMFMTKGKDNFMGYSNSKVDEIYSRIFYDSQENSLKTDYQALEEVFLEEQPIIGLFYIEGAVMAYDNVKVVGPTGFNVFNNIEKWYIKK